MPKICQKGKKIGPLDGHRFENMLAWKANECIGVLVVIAKVFFEKKNWKIIKKWLDLGDFLAFLAISFFNFLTRNHCRETENAKYFTRLTFGEAIAGVVTKEFGLVYPGYPKYADMAVWKKREKKKEKKLDH